MAVTCEVRYTFKDDAGKFSPSDCDVFYIGDQPWLTLHPWNYHFAKFVRQTDTGDKAKYRLTNHLGYNKILELRNEAHLKSPCSSQGEDRSSKAAATETMASLFGAQSSAPPEDDEDDASEDGSVTGKRNLKKTKRGLLKTNYWPDAARICENDELETRKFTIKLDDDTLWILRPCEAIEAISIPCDADNVGVVVKYLREHAHEGCFDARMYTKSGKYQKHAVG